MTSAIAGIDAPMTAPVRVYRHRLLVRLTHWTNALAIFVLLMSGLQIFNAHPGLYWGEYGADADTGRRWLEIGAVPDANGELHGMTKIGPWMFETTGLLGVSQTAEGRTVAIGFPHWLTLPSVRDLATGRRWHFFFAWVLGLNLVTYLAAGLATGHIRRDILPGRNDLRPRTLWQDIIDHARLRFPRGDEARRYHVLQRLAYSGVLLLIVLMVLTGLTMSPSNDAAWPWLTTLFGGRQSARSLHFIFAWSIVAFVVVHLVMVVLSGPFNQVRSMLTGWFTLPPERRA